MVALRRLSHASKPTIRNEAANEFIADVLPVRSFIKLQRMAISRLGKDGVGLEQSGVAYYDRESPSRIT